MPSKFAAALAALSVVSVTLVGCATQSPGAAVSTASPPPTATGSEPTTEAMLSECIATASASGPGPARQLERSDLMPSKTRTALRPDDVWYLAVPLDDPKAPAAQLDELQCLIRADGAVEMAAVREKPAVDDFAVWASARNKEGGL
ncbi:hypothetical protein ACIQLK_01395 [Microbacterium sp. NPDC091382]|uniref:hypothetical protein n=1 Tax=Microbacterium sp. NPDC091382 TaxID=3364210 RepID=UPI0037FB992F